MMNLFNWVSKIGFGKKDLQLERSGSGQWMVKRGFKVLCVGTEQKCQIFIAEAEGAYS